MHKAYTFPKKLSDKKTKQDSNVSKLDTYSKPLDSIRAIAVIGVILNHLNKNILPSGYLGVDIFFVLSGFVITASLVKRKETSGSSFFGGFYKRRVKRLLPALLFCFTSTAILISLFCRKPAYYIMTGLFSLPGLANMKMYRNSLDYWSESVSYNPFMHTWSLGVEEQFYFVFPLFLWLIIRGFWSGAKLVKVNFGLSVLCVISLLGYIYGHFQEEMMAYFLMPFRFWEIGFGCLLYLHLKLNGESPFKKMISKVPFFALLFSLCATLFLPKHIAPINTILAVLLTTIVIAKIKILEDESLVKNLGQKILTHPVTVYIGKISYSLYLWHWVVISISKWTVGISLFTVIPQLILMFLLAIFSYNMIEKPLRHLKWRSSYQAKFMLTGMLGIVCFFTAQVRFSPNENPLYLGNDSTVIEELKKLPAHKVVNSKFHKIRILGNSHSNHIVPMMNVFADEFSVDVVYDKRPNYVLIPNGDGRHLDKLDEVLAQLSKNDLLVLSSRYRYLYEVPYLNAKGDKWFDHQNKKNSEGWGLDMWLDELDAVINKAERKGINVILFMPNVEFDTSVHKADFCSPQWFRKPAEDCNQFVSKEFLNSRFPKKMYSEVQRKNSNNSNFFVFDPTQIYCPEPGTDYCSTSLNGIRLFKDTNHLSDAGALFMLDEFFAFLQKNSLI